MLKCILIFCFGLCFFGVVGQVEVEYDKKVDLTPYVSFKLGEGEIITPKDERVYSDTAVHRWVRYAIAKELKMKGLTQDDTGGLLVVTYIVGSHQATDAGNLGPLGVSPTNSDQRYVRDYRQGSLIIDLNDSQSNKLIWRIRGIIEEGTPSGQLAEHIVAQGLKKFSIQPSKKKKKKK